jgi:hypothetical protein
MTCSFDISSGFDNVSHVRYNIGDTDCTRAWFTNEEITAIVADQGSWQAAVISCLLNIVARLSGEPDFRADWLQVDYKTALDSYRKLLTIKARELGVPYGQIVATPVYIYRPDSDQTASPTYPLDANS